MKKIIILVAILLFPLISFANSGMFLKPAIFQPDHSLVAGKPYFALFYYSNQGSEVANIETHLECHKTPEDILCPDIKWLKIQGPERFTLQPGETKEIKIKIDIGRKANFKPNQYETLLIIQPTVDETHSEITTVIVPSLAGTLRFKISGKVAWFMSPIYKIQEFGNKLSASMQLAGVDPRTTLIASGALIFILIIFGIFKKIFRLIFRKKTKKPELQPQVQSQAPSEYLPKYFPREIDNRNWKL